MKIRLLSRGIVTTLAVLGICLPEIALAAPPTTTPAPTPAVVDIAMADGGVLHGQLIDLRGGNTAGVPVTLKAQNQDVVHTATVKDGHFTVPGLKGGVYQVAAGDGQGVYRLWTAKAAPPSAHNNAILFTAGGGAKMLLANPIVIAGVVATAVAIPVAVANSRPSSP